MKKVFSNHRLHQQLSLSFFLLTALTAILIVTLIFAGYAIYFYSGRVAEGVAAYALEDVERLVQIYDLKTELDSRIGQAYIDEYYPYFSNVTHPGYDAESQQEKPYFPEQIVILNPEGDIVASNYKEAYPVGEAMGKTSAPVFKTSWLKPKTTPDYFKPESLFRFGIKGDQHVGFAPVISEQNVLLGWIYLNYTDVENRFFFHRTARVLGWGFLGAAILAVLSSAFIGRILSRAFAKRLDALSLLSQSYAQGNFDKRFSSNGQDEFSQLGFQMNRMAEQIQTQMLELKELAEQNARLAEHAKAYAILEERNRLARELHDAIKQQLFGLNLSAVALKAQHQKNPELVGKQLDIISGLSTQVLEEMDHVIQQLRPASLENKGLTEALEDLLRQWSQQTSVATHFKSTGKRDLPLEYETALFRVTQEALQNVAKHTIARNVNVELNYSVDGVTLMIRDDGQGFDSAETVPSSSLGLKSMNERIEHLGGNFELLSQPNKGTQLNISLPHEALSGTLSSNV